MNNFIKFTALFLTLFFSVNISYSASVNTTSKPVINKVETKNTNSVTYTLVKSPTLVVANPYAYINKNIEFPAKFNKFSTLGLDYKPAMRESQAYIGVLIERDDVGNNIIPLSEFKMFLKRTDAEKLTDIETGDRVMVKGKVFSTALGDPWMDITEFKILTSKQDKAKTEK